MEDDEQKTVKPETPPKPTDPTDQPDASKLRKMSMSESNSAKLAQQQFKSERPIESVIVHSD